MAKFEVKKIGDKFIVGRLMKTGLQGSLEFRVPQRSRATYDSRKAAEKQAERLNKKY